MTKKFPARPAFCFAALLLSFLGGATSSSQALTLGEIEVRSFMGQPLDVRIALNNDAAEWVDPACFALFLGAGGQVPLAVPRAARFALDETLTRKIVRIRTSEPIVETPLRLQVRAGCDGQPRAEREYEVALTSLDSTPEAPTVITIIPSVPAVPEYLPGRAAINRAKRPAGSLIWNVREGDTLHSIARGLYPQSAPLQTAFVAALLESNPLLSVRPDEPLPSNGLILLPDLKAFADQSPRFVTPAGARSAEEKIDRPVAEKRLKRERIAKADAKETEKKERKKTAEAPLLSPQASYGPKGVVNDPPTHFAPPPPAEVKRGPPQGGTFRLKLSGAEIDLTRSRGVTDSIRNKLRGKQLILDSDDQVAELLSLKNTVKQLESRVNELQLKLSTQTQSPSPPGAKTEPALEKTPGAAAIVAAAPQPVGAAKPESALKSAPAATPAPAGLAPAPTLAKVDAPPPATPLTTPPTTLPTTTTTPSPTTTTTTPPTTTTTKSLPQQSAPAISANVLLGLNEEPWWKSTWIWLTAIGALAIAGIVLWSRREKSEQVDEAFEPAQAVDRNEFADCADAPVAEANSGVEVDSADWSAAPPDARHAGISLDDLAPDDAVGDVPLHPVAADFNFGDAASQVRLEDIPASLELDTRPATAVDFPVLGDENAEDRERRKRYVEERYPEIANGSITIDDPDSIINAARQYFEDGHIQKAIELLTYAFEERPGQLRFWLALFDVYRLERMTPEFCQLAAEFRDFHSGTDLWPKVQHIGRDLDPTNPLFAAALGRLGLPVDQEFDPIAENWLNAPMDFTSDVLMAELRHSLLDQFGVTLNDLQGPQLVPPR